MIAALADAELDGTGQAVSSLEEPSDPDKSNAASARRYLRRITPKE
jgi:hypothetical protein